MIQRPTDEVFDEVFVVSATTNVVGGVASGGLREGSSVAVSPSKSELLPAIVFERSAPPQHILTLERGNRKPLLTAGSSAIESPGGGEGSSNSKMEKQPDARSDDGGR